MKQNLILIGFMGAGKTTIGRLYAEAYGWPLLDTDHLIEAKAGKTIPEIFKWEGEAGFRQYETQMLRELLGQTANTVISVGGGLPLREENREILSQLGLVVYLDISAETVRERLKNQTGRPLLDGDNVEQRINDLLSYRRPIYEQAAHRIIRADDKQPLEIVAELKEMAGILE